MDLIRINVTHFLGTNITLFSEHITNFLVLHEMILTFYLVFIFEVRYSNNNI